MGSATRPEEALSQPTRQRLFRLLGDLRAPAGTEDLARRIGLHPNGVRVHLERLREAGLIQRDRVAQPRGRPRDMWSVDPGAATRAEPQRAYADLGRRLASVMSAGAGSLRAVEATGRKIGRTIAEETDAATAEASMHAVLSSMGFAPKRRLEGRGTLTYELCNCPYREAVAENQPVVCTLHRGITRGLLDTLAPDTRLTAFVARDPVGAGCLIELAGGLAGQALTSELPATHGGGGAAPRADSMTGA